MMVFEDTRQNKLHENKGDPIVMRGGQYLGNIVSQDVWRVTGR